MANDFVKGLLTGMTIGGGIRKPAVGDPLSSIHLKVLDYISGGVKIAGYPTPVITNFSLGYGVNSHPYNTQGTPNMNAPQPQVISFISTSLVVDPLLTILMLPLPPNSLMVTLTKLT